MSADDTAAIRVEVRTEAGTTVLSLGGDLDFGSAADLRTTLSDLARQKPGPILVDLSELRFVDSVGLSLLVQAKQRFDAEGLRFELRNASPNVARVIETSGLAEVFALDAGGS